MNKQNNLSNIIKFDSSFKTAINLYLSLNKKDKVLNYIPTKSSLSFMNEYLKAVIENKEQATLMIGPYGKGKSHLLLVLLAILSLERNEENSKCIKEIAERAAKVDDAGKKVADNILAIWNNKKRFLPVVLNNSKGDLNQAFMMALNDALRREGITDLIPDTFYSAAIDKINIWKEQYPSTYELFRRDLEKRNIDINNFIVELKHFSKDYLQIFMDIHPQITAGSDFNPLVVSDVLQLYKSISEKLVEEYNYSGIYIVFDEFSKFIEGQDGTAAGYNMKLLQDICELSVDSSNAQVFITMVAHKSIKEYGKYLSSEIINSFTGIEGRIIEKYFITSSKNNYELIKSAIVKDEDLMYAEARCLKFINEKAAEKYYQLPAFSSNFEYADFVNIVLKGCYPLNPVATYLLLNISEKVAQNERTLFTFISNDEPNSMARFIAEHDEQNEWSIGADLIYDYFKSLFKKDVVNELVHNYWLSAEYALSKCKSDDARKLIKALAIILIVNRDDEIPADDKYLPLATNLMDAEKAINELVAADLIYKKKSTGTYVFKTRAGSDLKKEIKKQRELKGDSTNYSRALLQISNAHFVLPRRYNTVNAITRYFKHEFIEKDAFMSINNAEAFFEKNDFSDGKVISLYGFEEYSTEQVKQHIENLECKKLVVVVPEKHLEIKEQLRDYEILQDLKQNQTFNENNAILKKEIPLLEEDILKDVQRTIDSIYYDDESAKVYYYDGESVKVAAGSQIEQVVNDCCNNLFTKSVIINNELINRSQINTGQTKKARQNIVQAILEHRDDEDFYKGTNQEATIYRSLMCNTGLIYGEAGTSLIEVIDVMNDFVDSCCDCKRDINQLIDILTAAPYGLRRGVLPIYWAYVLTNRHEDLVIYNLNTEVSLDAETVINMCNAPDNFKLYVSKEDVQKEKYISSMRGLFKVDEHRNLTDNRIKDILVCMQRWFRSLPQVTRNLTNIDDYFESDSIKEKMKSLRKIMQKADVNSFEALFVTIPETFESESLEETFEQIDKCHTAFEDYFDWIQKRIVDDIYALFNPKKKENLYHVLKEWYDNQSNISKQGLHGGKVTNLMSCIEKINVYDDIEIAARIAKTITDVYIENWTDRSFDEFCDSLTETKENIEKIKDIQNNNKNKLSFVNKNGELVERYYTSANESTGNILRNILEDTLDDFDDLSVNDRVAILIEMIEKTIG